MQNSSTRIFNLLFSDPAREAVVHRGRTEVQKYKSQSLLSGPSIHTHDKQTFATWRQKVI